MAGYVAWPTKKLLKQRKRDTHRLLTLLSIADGCHSSFQRRTARHRCSWQLSRICFPRLALPPSGGQGFIICRGKKNPRRVHRSIRDLLMRAGTSTNHRRHRCYRRHRHRYRHCHSMMPHLIQETARTRPDLRAQGPYLPSPRLMQTITCPRNRHPWLSVDIMKPSEKACSWHAAAIAGAKNIPQRRSNRCTSVTLEQRLLHLIHQAREWCPTHREAQGGGMYALIAGFLNLGATLLPGQIHHHIAWWRRLS